MSFLEIKQRRVSCLGCELAGSSMARSHGVADVFDWLEKTPVESIRYESCMVAKWHG